MTQTRHRGQKQRKPWSGSDSRGPLGRQARRGLGPAAGETRPRRRTSPATPELPEDRVHCRACGLPVTSEAYMRSVAGQVLHHRTNPAGVAFTFGCFSAAPGAEPVGEATGRHSWFPGCAWRLALCWGCGTHLGWQFEGAEPTFFGLILDRLTTRRGAAGEVS